MMRDREKPHRLAPEMYRGQKAIAFTACERNRKPLFATPEIHAAFRTALESAADKHKCLIPVYCLMPDHIHILTVGISAESDGRTTMNAFKYQSGFWLAKNRPDLGWQKDFYDHIVRYREGWEKQARYIALNPVRRGLTDDVFDWPYTGSIGMDREETIFEAFW